MPKTWIYFVALVMPMVFSILVLYTSFPSWFWYKGYEEVYYTLSALSVNETFREFAGWPLIMFTGCIFSFWMMEMDEDEAIANQFLLLPIIYVPFSIFGALISKGFDAMLFIIHPLVVIPSGYLYMLPWIVFLWLFQKLRLVM